MTLAPVCAIPRRELGSTGLHLSALGFGASPLGGVFQVPSAQLDVGAESIGVLTEVHFAVMDCTGRCPADLQPAVLPCCGGANLGRHDLAEQQCTDHYNVSPQAIDERAGVAAVHHAHARGINYFDTSPFYGATKSESVLGQALRDLPRSEFVLSTKVGRYGQDSFDFSAARVTASVAESLQRLQVPYIDIVLCHDVEFGDLHQASEAAGGNWGDAIGPYTRQVRLLVAVKATQIVNETLPALHQLKSQGLVKHVGFSALPLNVFSWIIDKAPPGQVEVVLSYCHHSLNDSSLCDMLPYFESKGVGVIGASPMAMGLLTNQGPPAWHPAPAPLQQACANAAAHAAAQGVDISKLALKHSVRLPGISSTLVGMASAELVDTNIATTLQALGQQANENEAQESRVAAEVLGLLAPVQGVTWPSGKPLPC
ncbi:hypothetical protein QJQ45_015115 [Haematococcus lacustris]|nr:hypothetical protein QJQ45_015115 [Haematococcus lacustris]